MKRKARAARGPRKRVAPTGATNPALEGAPALPPTDRQREIVDAIDALASTGEPVTDAAIARKLGVTRQGIRPQLAALESKGLAAAATRRVIVKGQWALTERGQALLKADEDKPLISATHWLKELEEDDRS